MKTRALSTITYVLAFGACTVSPAGIGSSPAPVSPARSIPVAGSSNTDATTAFEVIDGSNSARTRQGLPLITANEAMNKAAMAYARELAQRHTINHMSATPGLEDPAKRLTAAGVKWSGVGENLALISSRAGVADIVIRGWLNSPPHRENLLDPHFKVTGAGVARDEQGNYYVVQMYATLR